MPRLPGQPVMRLAEFFIKLDSASFLELCETVDHITLYSYCIFF